MEVKRRWLLILIVANLAALLALAFAYPQLMVSPGPLVRGHAELATDCFACHAPWRGASAARCIGCHALPDIGLRTSKGAAIAERSRKPLFHQQLTAQDCMACHSDHLGPQLTGHSRKPFSHLLLRPAIRGNCETCHAPPRNPLHAKLAQGCGQCHKPEGWKPASFDHDKQFLLDEDHNSACLTCHTGNDYGRYTCYGCHEHSVDKVRAEHQDEGIRDFEDCVKCHRNARDKPEGEGAGGDDERD